jgi:NifU-like protein involved in Fe-S cluster formation
VAASGNSLDAAFPFGMAVKAKPRRQNPFSRHRVSTYIFNCAAEAIRRIGKIGKSSMLNEVYNAKILDLAGNIPRLGRLATPDASATAHSKLCGSTVTVDLKMDGPVVADFAHDVKACALGQASSSIMARHVVGANPTELRELRETVRKMLKENGPPPSGKWADIAVLEPVRDYKARHASTMLTFDAVVSALDQIEAKKNQNK